MKRAVFIVILIMPLIMLQAQDTTFFVIAPEYQIFNTKSNNAVIQAKDFGKITVPGMPGLPVKTISIPLAPGLTVSHVHIIPGPVEIIQLEHPLAYNAPMIGNGSQHQQIQDIAARTFHVRDSIYTSDDFFPNEFGVYEGSVSRNGREIVHIKFSPFRYNPVHNELERTASLTVYISCFKNGTDFLLKTKTEISGTDLSNDVSLIIFGAPEFQEAVSSFILWKRSLGYQVEYIDTESIPGWHSSDEKEKTLRTFLSERFNEKAFTHLLLLGSDRKCPVPRLYSNPNNPFSFYAVPSDYFYTELNIEWDSDGDGRAGEYMDDKTYVMPDIAVGRIPWDDPELIKSSLENAVIFEQSGNASIPEALLIGAMSNFSNEGNAGDDFFRTDGAELMEILKSEIFIQNGSTSLYEKAGLDTSFYSGDLHLDKNNIYNSLASGRYRLVTWWSHGTHNAAERKIWVHDNGDGVAQNDEIKWETYLDINNYPVNAEIKPVIFANACDNAWPERESLAKSLLVDGSSGIIASSRESYYILGWDKIEDGGNASLTFLFWNYFYQEGLTMGEALNSAREEYFSRFSDAWQHLHNIYTFQIYGDPTLRLVRMSPEYGGIKGEILAGYSSSASVKGVRVSTADGSCLAFSDSSGQFTLFPLPAGDSEIQFNVPEGGVFSRIVTIEPGMVQHMTFDLVTTGLPENPQHQNRAFSLLNNYPNPFNASTVIPFILPKKAHVNITVYNAAGARVFVLADESLPAGKHEYRWSGESANGRTAASGMYIIKMQAEGFTASRKMLYIN